MVKRDDFRAITAGAIIAVGLFQTWAAADILLVAYFFFIRKHFTQIPEAFWIIALIPFVTIPWSEDQIAAGLWAVRILFLFSMVADNTGNRKWMIALPMIALLIQGCFSLFVWLDHRPLTFSINSEVMAAVGFAALGPTLLGMAAATLTIGVSGARLPVALLAMTAVLTRRRAYIVSAVAVSVMFVIQAAIISPERLSFDRLNRDWGIRETLIDLSNTDNAKAVIASHRPDLLEKPIMRKWSVLGYGYRSYVENTAASTPHNIFILAWYEMGILAIPFFGAAFWLIRRWPVWAILSAVAYITFVDTWYWMPSAVYAIALFGYHGATSSSTNGVTDPSGPTTPLS